MWLRYLCTAGFPKGATGPNANLADAVRELKRHVHRLYKHIHPDRLGQHPQERSINESSFQVLQSALERHFSRMDGSAQNQGSIPPPAPQKPQQLVFFSQGKEKHLKKAVVHFHESTLGKTLHSLFESLSLDPPPKHLLPGHSSPNQPIEFSSLTQLMRHARQVAMHTTSKRHSATTQATTSTSTNTNSDTEHEVIVTRLALQRSRGVSIALGTGLPVDGKLFGVYRRLVLALREIRDIDLSTLIIEFNGGFDVQLNDQGSQPWLSLGVCATADLWQTIFASEQLRLACEESRYKMEAIREAEALAAHALGVRLMMHDITLVEKERTADSNGITSGLDTFLERSALMNEYEKLLKDIITKWRLNPEETHINNVKPLAVMITTGETLYDEDGNFSSDLERGVLCVPLSASTGGVSYGLRKDGPRVAALYTQKAKHREMEKTLVSRIRTGLQLGGLRRANGLEDKLYISALHQLKRHGGKLKGIFDGAAIVIGTQARLLIDTDEVEIPHDFHTRMPI